jgi:mono/diheme cytochrome c family protein
MPRRRRDLRRAASLLGAVVIAALVVSCGRGRDSRESGSSSVEVPVPTLDAALVTRGRDVYLQNCAACHGAKSQGAPNWQQPDARGDLPPPSHDDDGHTWRHGDAELTGIIKNGLRDRFNKTPELTMPPFKGRLNDEENAAVIAYFKSLWSPEHRRYQEQQTQRGMMATPEGTP